MVALQALGTVRVRVLSKFFYRGALGAFIVLSGLLTGCGQKGPLVLPPQTAVPVAPATTPPAIATPKPASPNPS